VQRQGSVLLDQGGSPGLIGIVYDQIAHSLVDRIGKYGFGINSATELNHPKKHCQDEQERESKLDDGLSPLFPVQRFFEMTEVESSSSHG
jgi:hypothetical protein